MWEWQRKKYIKSSDSVGEESVIKFQCPFWFNSVATQQKLWYWKICIKLKFLPDRFRNISIAHDMTQKERDDCKALVDEVKSKSANETGNGSIVSGALPEIV